MSAEEADEGGEIIEATVVKPKRGKKKFLIAGAAALLLVGGGGAGVYAFSGHGGEEASESAGDTAQEHGEAEEFVDVPPMMVNLRSSDGAARFVKLHFMLVPGAKAKGDALKDKLPLLMDSYQPFLRELRPEDLAGSAAVFRIKEEMLVRANAALGPDQVKDVLIQDLIQQ